VRPECTVILAEPENPKNIGFVARAMKCNGMDTLRIVSPEDVLSQKAFVTGTSADTILDATRFYTSLSAAVSDCTRVVGFSRRKFKNTPVKTVLSDLPGCISQNDRVALVFGRESSGLNTDELSQCDILCAIPAADRMSYNLGQAAGIVFYELAGKPRYTQASFGVTSPAGPTHKEKDTLFNFFAERVPKDIFTKGNRAINLRNSISKMNLTRDELHMILGLLKSMSR
jgi:TrmH family RNA methyltransferase